MRTLLSIFLTLFTFSAIAGSNMDLSTAELEDLKNAEMILFEGQGYEVIQTLAASSNYYCKKKNHKWVRCSKVTGQCFGEPMDTKFQCEKALPSGKPPVTEEGLSYTCEKNNSNKYVRCSKSTGQCYGAPMETKQQCLNSEIGQVKKQNANIDCKAKNHKWQAYNLTTGQSLGGLFETYDQCRNAY